MTNETKDAVTRKIVDFLTDIGIEVIETRFDDKAFLPGIRVERGKILFDKTKLTYPGDLLHEAGHLALASGDVRPTLNGEVVLPGSNMAPIEVYAIAWSYAAALNIGLDPLVVFHQGGYAGESERLVNNFSLGVYIGVNGLEDAGLTATGERARELNIPPYPHMIKWLGD